MDSINDLLKNRDYSEPPEIERLKKYIWDNYQYDSVVSIRDNAIIISVGSSSLVSSLRYRLPEMQRALKIDQKISLRVH